MIPVYTIAPFPHFSKEQRRYAVEFVDGNNVAFDERLNGSQLPISDRLRSLDKISPAEKLRIMENTQIFTDLPKAFFETFLRIQYGRTPILTIPKIQENKNVSVRSCLENNEHFTTGELAIKNWRELGWESIEQYQAWLDSSVLFAFSHCTHYCSATRIFDVDTEAMAANPDRKFRFKLQERELAKKTNIYTVTGYEFRNIHMDPPVAGDALCQDIQAHTKQTIQQMLTVAQKTDTTDIVLIPFGMGVFVPSQFATIKDYLITGINDGLRDYKGPKISIHWCGPAGKLEVNNDCVEVIQHTGQDAYTIANAIQDQGDVNHQKTEDGRVLKSMLVNAGDNDWTALLDPNKTPGQFYRGHTLFHDTSDEYYALVTEFTFHSIQNLMWLFPNLAEVGKLEQVKGEIKPGLAVSHELKIEDLTQSHESPQTQVSLYQAKNGELALKFPNRRTRDEFLSQLQIEALSKFQQGLLGGPQDDLQYSPIFYRNRDNMLFIPCRKTRDTVTQQEQLVLTFSSIGQAKRFYDLLGFKVNMLGQMRGANHPLGNYPNIYLVPGKLLKHDESLVIDLKSKSEQRVEQTQPLANPANRYGRMFRPETPVTNEELDEGFTNKIE